MLALTTKLVFNGTSNKGTKKNFSYLSSHATEWETDTVWMHSENSVIQLSIMAALRKNNVPVTEGVPDPFLGRVLPTEGHTRKRLDFEMYKRLMEV